MTTEEASGFPVPEESSRYPDTPLFRQYRTLRQEAGSAILLFRLGDFFELFGDQAEQVSKLLGLTLTSRDRNRPDPLPMCGIPAKSLDLYLPRLVHAGHSVAIAEQTTQEADDSGLFPREIVRTVTRFTLLDDPARDEGRAQNGVAVVRDGAVWGAVALDLASGRIAVWEPEASRTLESLKDWMERKEVRELILPEAGLARLFPGIPHVVAEPGSYEPGTRILPAAYALGDLSPLSREAMDLMLGFVASHERSVLHHLRGVDREGDRPALLLDRWTIRHLDILPPAPERGEHRRSAGSLVSLLDRCRTPLGSRTLRRFLLSPDRDPEAILAKHRVQRGFSDHPRLPDRIAPILRRIGDLERALSRISLGNRPAKDIPDFHGSFSSAMELVSLRELQGLVSPDEPAMSMGSSAHSLNDLLGRALADSPASALGEGPVVREDFDPLLSDYRKRESEGDRALAMLEERERKNTGIDTLRIRYNQVAGYYIEVSRVQARQMPESYFRKQTLTHTERFTLPELIAFESGIREARSKVLQRESEILEELRKEILGTRESVHRLADFAGRLDALLSFFEVGRARGYVLPEITAAGEALILENGRHPVLESVMDPGSFMPNDTALGAGEFIILTGPNMAGKSTYMRQVALSVIMAHAGSPVPADRARIPLTDRVIARVGASDNILEGASTFMVEMTEVARILASTTRDSLVLLDEVGRGTSTYDGMAMAWAISEFLHDRIGARTYFATHYHELSELATTRSRVRNQTVRVSVRNGELLFEHRISDGRAEQSYGIEVARLAGLPKEIVDRAFEVLAFWEGTERQRISSKKRLVPPERDLSMPLFSWKKNRSREGTPGGDRPPSSS